MQGSWPIRYLTNEPLGDFDPGHTSKSKYPFEDLPSYKLHIPYHFVILNTGKKLYQLYGSGPIDFLAFALSLPWSILAVRNIYVAWMKSQPNSSAFGRKDDGKTSVLPNTTEDQGPRPSRHHQSGGGSAHQSGSQGAQDPAAAGPSGIQRGADLESLAPYDSISNLEPDDVQDTDQVSVDDEDDEWEDGEFFAGVQLWAKDVWAATYPDHPSDSEVTIFEETVEHII
jgi:hypothetical protein